MALASGTRLGPYEIGPALGAGGMGEVYRATDTSLKRQVALKVLPVSVAADADRLARFQREAEVLAALNHPHIAQIFGIERSAGTIALVMELVEGEDLADRIARGPIPLDEALPIARQIAEALAAAHEQGIIHRDLKPANVKVRDDGTVKVLDFGLAKTLESAAASSPHVSMSPTITTPAMTQAGMILGTAAYMSPEQAKGRPADRRSDIWALGCVLYEMLSGARPFVGEDVADTLAHILTKEPDWSALPAQTPPAIRRLLRKCVERDRHRRLDSALAVRLEIDSAASDEAVTSAAAVPVPVGRSARVPWAVAVLGVLAAAVAIAGWAPWRATPQPARLAFEVPVASGGGASPMMFAVSPDGRHIVARVQDAGTPRLWVRPLAQTDGTVLPRTDGAAYPFWSPDGKAIGFFADRKLKAIDLGGSALTTITDAPNAYGGTWNRDGVMLFSSAGGAIQRVAAGGGPATPVTQLDSATGVIDHRFPLFLPDGVHFVFLARRSPAERSAIVLASLASSETHQLVETAGKPGFLAPDLLVFVRGDALVAERIDLGRGALTGASTSIAEPIYLNDVNGTAAFSLSDTGVLAYRSGSHVMRQLAWVERGGTVLETIGGAAPYQNPRLSPDGRRLAVFKAENGGDVWVTDLERQTSTRFTLDPASDDIPVWSPDGSRIAFVSDRNGGIFNIYEKSAGGTGPDTLLLATSNNKVLNDWSPDGRYLLYEEDDPQSKRDLWMLPLDGDRRPSKLLATPFNERMAVFSPDGRWVAYASDESGTSHVYLQRFPTSDRKWQVSSSASVSPRWGRDGKELFFDSAGTLHAVGLSGDGAGMNPGAATSLFQGLLSQQHSFDVGADGRVLAVLGAGLGTGVGGGQPVKVIVNWTSGLSRAP